MIAAVERCTRRNGGEALFTRVSTPVAVSSQTPLLATATNLLRGNMASIGNAPINNSGTYSTAWSVVERLVGPVDTIGQYDAFYNFLLLNGLVGDTNIFQSEFCV